MSAAILQRVDAHLIERARVAYAKAGGTDQPSDASDVSVDRGITTITLRNINGVLAMYRYGGAALKRANIVTDGGTA